MTFKIDTVGTIRLEDGREVPAVILIGTPDDVRLAAMFYGADVELCEAPLPLRKPEVKP